MDKKLASRAQQMAKSSGMPLDPPPPIPPTEHIPAVDQPESHSANINTVNKPMGAMMNDADDEPMPVASKGYKTKESYGMPTMLNSSQSSSSSSSGSSERKNEVNERLAWERKHREKSEFMNKMKDNAPRSALSARLASNKGGDPILNGIVEGTNGSSLDPFAFAEDKKDLQDTMNNNERDSSSSSAAESTTDISNNVLQNINSMEEQNPSSNSNGDPYDALELLASAKSSELIARAGSGDAFLGSVLGVGGLDDVLAQIQRRVWIPLAAPPTLLAELGIQPVRGLLLYG